VSIPRHAHDIDASDLALRIEAEEHGAGIAAREQPLHQVQYLVIDRAASRTWAPVGDAPYSLSWRNIACTESSVMRKDRRDREYRD
jgi:hypothetical protein